MGKLKVAVIGTGRLGTIHARVYKEIPEVELVGICDIDPAKLQTVSAQYNIPAYTDYRELIDKVDAVSIAVPTNKHHEVAKFFLEKGVSTLIEKPITLDLDSAKDLIKIAEKNNATLQVGHVERFNSAYVAIEKIVKNPRFIECHRLSPFPHRSLDIGVVLDVMIHDIDIILGLVKSKIKSIEAMGVPVLTPYEDIANVRLTFQDGCVCNLTASRISEEAMRKIRIFLPDTYISLDYGKQEAFLFKKDMGKISKELLPIEKEEPLKKEIESFVDCVVNKKKPLVSGEEAYQALLLADRIVKDIWKKKKSIANWNEFSKDQDVNFLKQKIDADSQQKKLFVVAGEVSGDMHAASLIKELKALNPNIKIMGLGGKRMQEEGVKLFFDLTKIAVIGFTEVLRNIWLHRKIFYDFIKRAEQERPDAIILVDYPGFNLRLAKELKKRGFRVIYYISPQIWAWGKERIEIIKENVDKMIVLFDFEKDIYLKEGINVDFVGHPLLDSVHTTLPKEQFVKVASLENKKPIITLMPGSRKNVVMKNLPIMIESAKIIYKNFPNAQFLVLSSSNVDIDIYHSQIKKTNLPIRLFESQHYNAIACADLALCASGTVTLETAILNTPMLIIYKVSFLTWAFAKTLVKIPYIGLVNVIAQRQIIPEYIQFNAKPEVIAREAIELLNKKERYQTMLNDLSQIKKHLGSPGASRKAAESILSMF